MSVKQCECVCICINNAHEIRAQNASALLFLHFPQILSMKRANKPAQQPLNQNEEPEEQKYNNEKQLLVCVCACYHAQNEEF